jgi:hypothetical protein
MVSLSDLHDIRVEEQDLSSGDLSITADENESLEILARGVSGANADDQILESVDEETMLAYQHEDGTGELFPEEVVENLGTDILKEMREEGLQAPTIKVPEGQEYRLINDSSSAGDATVLYRQGAATSVSSSETGAPDNKERTFITTAEDTQSVAGSSTETQILGTSGQPGILRDWPWEEDVPPNREYDLQAIMFEQDADSGSNVSLDTFRLQSEEREFLANDSDFVDVNLADYPNTDLTRQPFIFPEEPTFSPGDQLDVEVEASNTTSGSEDSVVSCTIISYRRDV